MKLLNGFFRYLFYFILILIGVIIGVAIRHYYNLPIAETINIVDVATLVVTIFLAVYIPEVLDRKLQIKKDKKDLIETRIVQLQSLYRKINLIVQGEEKMISKDFLIIKNTLDIIHSKLDTIATLLTYANLNVSFADDINNIRRLTSEHKKLLYSEQMESAGFNYSISIVQNEELIYNKIDRVSSLLIFKLSDA